MIYVSVYTGEIGLSNVKFFVGVALLGVLGYPEYQIIFVGGSQYNMFSGLFQWLLGAGAELAVLIISMVPLVELRGAVPLGVAAGLPATVLFPLAILGNMIPIPFLLFFGEKILDWVCTLPPLTKFATAYKEKLLSKTDQVTKYARLGLFLFVAIPLPGTGAWSGALIATILKMPKMKALFSILCGVITAGIIMLIGSHGALGVFRLF